MAKRSKTPAEKTPLELSWIAEGLRPLAVEIERLVPDPDNARTHDEQSVNAIAASLRRYGQLRALVAQRDSGVVLAGNGVLLAALQLGWTHLAVVWGELDGTAARGFAIADNRTAELSGWDNALLRTQIDLIEATMPELTIDWRLAELRESIDRHVQGENPGEGPNETSPEAVEQLMPEHFDVVVECENETDQRTMYERLVAEGRKCRLLTL